MNENNEKRNTSARARVTGHALLFPATHHQVAKNQAAKW